MRRAHGMAAGLAVLLAATMTGVGAERRAGQAPAALLERARALMKRVPLIDGHNDLPWEMRKRAGYDLATLDIRLPQPQLETDIRRLRDGQVGAQFWSVYVPADMAGQDAVTATLEQIAFVHEMVRRYPDVFEVAGTADDVERIFRAGRIASLMGVEGGHSIDSSLGALRMMYRLGARYMTLTHNSNTPWADAASDKPQHNGLTAFGEAVVREMNWLGMLVDIAHVSDATMGQVLKVSEAPVIFSHSSARAICDVPRNVSDDILRRLPVNGGVVLVNFYAGFVAPDCADRNRRRREEADRVRQQFPTDTAARSAAMDKWDADNPPKATLAQVADHIDHIRQVAGIESVGIGSDFDGIDGLAPDGLEDVSKYPALVAELLRRGYSDADVEKVIGRNVLRVLRRAEQVAAQLQARRGPSTATIAQLDGKR